MFYVLLSVDNEVVRMGYHLHQCKLYIYVSD